MASNQPQIEVAVVIKNDADELVLIRYGWGTAAGLWGLPRTVLSHNETLAEAVQRIGEEFLDMDILSGGVKCIKEFLPVDAEDHRSHRVRLIYQGVLLAPMGADSDGVSPVELSKELRHHEQTQDNPGPVEVMLVGLEAMTSFRLESDVLDVLEELDILATDVHVLDPLED